MTLTSAIRSLSILAAVAMLIACRSSSTSTYRGRAPTSGLERVRAAQAKTRGVADGERGRIVGAAYDDAFAGLAVDRVTGDELAAWYQAAQIAAFFAQDPVRARTLASLLDALEQHGRARDRDYADLYRTYVGARMFNDARQLAMRHPISSVEVLPTIREIEPIPARVPSKWTIGPSGELEHRRVELDNGAQLVIIAHPNCHFSQQAVADLEREPDLRIALTHGIWLAPQANRLDVETIAEWNHQHPGLEIALAVRRDEWPMIDSWGTPTFYIVEHGVAVAKVEGWPSEGRRDELRTALRRSGLLPDPDGNKAM